MDDNASHESPIITNNVPINAGWRNIRRRLTVQSQKFCKAKPESEQSRLSEDAIIELYVEREFLPGFFQTKVFLIISLILPFVDFITDYSNAGTG